MPIEPTPTPWVFPDPTDAPEDLVALGADLEPGTILAAYRSGYFPMHVNPSFRSEGRSGPGRRDEQLGWWSPDPRGVIPLDGLRVTRSLARSTRRYEVRVDTDFEAVIDGCADPDRDGRWIVPSIRAAYLELHRLGWAHSVEAWDRDGGVLAGGLYGIAIGGFFAGESMFHRRTDASKVALVGLVDRLRSGGALLLDVQWCTSHLSSLGAVGISKVAYLTRLRDALDRPLPPAFSGVG